MLARKLVKVTINGVDYELPEGMYLTEAAKLVGIEIPQFCAYRWLEPLGACRMCLVRVDKVPKLQIACALPVRDGLNVVTESEEIRQAREEMLEFHLLNHPLECPVCDRGGECPLQDLTERYGKYKSRYIEEKLVRPDTNLNPFLRMNYKRCILCKRCVRYCDEVARDHLIEFEDRGGWTKVTTFLGTDAPNRFSGNIIELCPVGAITSIPFRFRGRAWELEKTKTICSQCSVGCNIELHTRLGKLQRIVPAVNEELDDGHICDRGRFAYGWVHSPDRLRKPLIKSETCFEEIAWSEAEALLADKITSAVSKFGADSVAVLAGNSLTNEEYFVLRKFSSEFIGTSKFSFLSDIVDVSASSPLLREILTSLGSISEIMASELILLVGTDVLEESPVLGLRIEEAVRKYGSALATFSSYQHDSERMASVRAYYEPGRFLAGITKLCAELEGKAETSNYSELVSLLRTASRISIVFGQDIMFGGKAGRNAEAVYAFARLLRRVREGNGNILSALNITPVFRGANSMGALVASSQGSFTAERMPSFSQILENCASGQVKVLLLIGVNPLASFPDARLARLAIENVEFVVALDIFLNETSSSVHLVLPVCPFIFKDGTFINFEGRLQRVRSAQTTDFAPCDLEVINRLLVALGKGSSFASAEETFARLASETREFPSVRFGELPYEGIVIKFDGKQADASISMPVMPDVRGSKDFPFVLIPKHYLFRNSMELEHTEWMNEVIPGEWALMNEADMASLGVSDGEDVVIESSHGSIVLTAKPCGSAPKGAVVVDKRIKGKSINSLISLYDEIYAVRVVKR